jgi:transposase-like protein
MRRPRRNHTAAFKAKVAVAALKDDKTLAELAEKFDLHANQIAQWRAQLIEASMGVTICRFSRCALATRTF